MSNRDDKRNGSEGPRRRDRDRADLPPFTTWQMEPPPPEYKNSPVVWVSESGQSRICREGWFFQVQRWDADAEEWTVSGFPELHVVVEVAQDFAARWEGLPIENWRDPQFWILPSTVEQRRRGWRKGGGEI